MEKKRVNIYSYDFFILKKYIHEIYRKERTEEGNKVETQDGAGFYSIPDYCGGKIDVKA